MADDVERGGRDVLYSLARPLEPNGKWSGGVNETSDFPTKLIQMKFTQRARPSTDLPMIRRGAVSNLVTIKKFKKKELII